MLKFPWPNKYAATFPVYVTNSKGLFYRVYIFQDQNDLHSYLKTVNEYFKQSGRKELARFSKRTGGAAIYNSPDPKSRVLGTVVLSLESVGAGLVSHELTHAATYYLYDLDQLSKLCIVKELIKGRKDSSISMIDNKVDELLANTQGNFVTQFWIKFNKKFPNIERVSA